MKDNKHLQEFGNLVRLINSLKGQVLLIVYYFTDIPHGYKLTGRKMLMTRSQEVIHDLKEDYFITIVP